MSGSDNSERVVVGVDGSAGSLAALQFAFDEAKRRATGLLVVTAFALPEVWSVTYGLPVITSIDEIRDNVQQNTRRLVTDTLGDQMTADGAPEVDVVAQDTGASLPMTRWRWSTRPLMSARAVHAAIALPGGVHHARGVGGRVEA